MLLDAPALDARLTPEIALGIVTKELQRKGWKEQQVHELKLVYTPYWVFSFDVITTGGPSPTGKTALNAYTGDLSDFVPMLLDRPVKRVRETPQGAKPEIEQTAVSFNEVKSAAATKVAAHAGLKPEQVSISAVSKVYVPSYRIWVDVAGDTFKFEIDAALGFPTGFEAVPKRQQAWDEATKETLDKMKSPKGWVDLASRAAGSATAVAGEAAKGDDQGKMVRYAILGLVILALLWMVFGGLQGGSEKVSCELNSAFLTKAGWFGLVAPSVRPATNASSYYVQGTCSFVNEGSRENAVITAQVHVNDKKTGLPVAVGIVNAVPPAKSSTATVKNFELDWNETSSVTFGFEKV